MSKSHLQKRVRAHLDLLGNAATEAELAIGAVDRRIAYMPEADLFIAECAEPIVFGYDDLAFAIKVTEEMPVPMTAESEIDARNLRSSVERIAAIAHDVFGAAATVHPLLERSDETGAEDLVLEVRYPGTTTDEAMASLNSAFLSRFIVEVPAEDRGALMVLPYPAALANADSAS